MWLAGIRAGLRPKAALAIVAAAALSGCTDISQLQFRVDHYVKFVAPESRAKVSLPVTLRWQVDGFRVAEPGPEPPSKDAGYFAIFVDRAPIKPGQTLAAVTSDDPACNASAGGPTTQCLKDQQVYETTNSFFTLRHVVALSGDNDNWQLHDVTIVLLDTSGHRIGEHAYYRDFKLKQSDAS